MKSSIVTVLFGASLGVAALSSVGRAHAQQQQGGPGMDPCAAFAAQAGGGGASLHGLVGRAGADLAGATEAQQQALGGAIAAIAEGEARVLEAQRDLMIAIADQAGRSGQVNLGELAPQVDAVAAARQELAMISREVLGQLHAQLQAGQRAAFADAFQRGAGAMGSPGAWFQGFAGDVGLDASQQAALGQGVAGLGPDFDAAQAHGQAGIAAFRGAHFPGAGMATVAQLAQEARESTARYVAVIAGAMAEMQKEQLARAVSILRAPVGAMAQGGGACPMGMGAACCPQGAAGAEGAFGGPGAMGAPGAIGGPDGGEGAEGAYGQEQGPGMGPGQGAAGHGARAPHGVAPQQGPGVQGAPQGRGGEQADEEEDEAEDEGEAEGPGQRENVGAAQGRLHRYGYGAPYGGGYGVGYGYGVPYGGYRSGYGYGVPYGGGYDAGYGYFAPYGSGYGYATPFGYGQGSTRGYSSRQVSRSQRSYGYSSGFGASAGYGGWGLFF